MGNLGHRRVGCGREVVVKVGVREGGMTAGGERRAVAKVACVGLEEGLRAWAGDEAGPKIGVQESTAHEVDNFNGGGRARGSGVEDDGRRVGLRKERVDQESEKGSRKCERGQWRGRKH